MKINKKLKNTEKGMLMKNHKVIVGILTIAILGLILFAGPTKAFVLGLDAKVVDPTNNETIIFTASIDIQSVDKYLPIKTLKLNIGGLTPLTSLNSCIFDVNGNKDPESKCKGMEIKKISEANAYGYGYGYGYDNSYGYSYGYDTSYGYGYDFGYGYGYGYGNGETELVYEITLDTSSYDTGTYEAWLGSKIGNENFESKDRWEFTKNSPVAIIGNRGSSSGSNSLNFGYCGDGYCDTDESVDTCPIDCPADLDLLETGSKNPLELEKNDNPNFFSGITGAVIGFAKTGRGVASLTFAFVILVAGSFVIFTKRKAK